MGPLKRFDSAGVEIAFIDEGEGPATLLIHGFASNLRVNWVSTSWLNDLLAADRRVIAFDNRGHGESGKPHDPLEYPAPTMAEDARRLLDHLAVERADVIGYSMGARIGAFLALAHPERVRRLVFGGLGEGMVKGVGPAQPIAAALRAASVDGISDQQALGFRVFADRTGSDREALAACILAARQVITPAELQKLTMPVLVAVGSEDEVGGSAGALAAIIPGAEAFVIPGRDHMKAVGDRRHKQAVLEFLGRGM
jgi:pimeloyl-ACP methyl ester carboxylesterase